MFKSTCLIWLSGQINQMSKWMAFGFFLKSNKPWFLVVGQNYIMKNVCSQNYFIKYWFK
jgi:hypothetical protein